MKKIRHFYRTIMGQNAGPDSAAVRARSCLVLVLWAIVLVTLVFCCTKVEYGALLALGGLLGAAIGWDLRGLEIADDMEMREKGGK